MEDNRELEVAMAVSDVLDAMSNDTFNYDDVYMIAEEYGIDSEEIINQLI